MFSVMMQNIRYHTELFDLTADLICGFSIFENVSFAESYGIPKVSSIQFVPHADVHFVE